MFMNKTKANNPLNMLYFILEKKKCLQSIFTNRVQCKLNISETVLYSCVWSTEDSFMLLHSKYCYRKITEISVKIIP